MLKVLHFFHKSEPELEVKEPETFQSPPLELLHFVKTGQEPKPCLLSWWYLFFQYQKCLSAPLSLNLEGEREQLESTPLCSGQSTQLENESCGQTPWRKEGVIQVQVNEQRVSNSITSYSCCSVKFLLHPSSTEMPSIFQQGSGKADTFGSPVCFKIQIVW